MLSIVAAFHNSRATAINCLKTMLRTAAQLQLPRIEFLLIDDASDADQRIPELIAEFRAQAPPAVSVKQMLFRQHQHYTRALAYGFSAIDGNSILFVSHDMMLTAPYVRTLLAVSELDESIGLVRGTSPFVDGFPQHRVQPPAPLRSFEELDAFSDYVSRWAGLQWVEDRVLTGDSMLIRREVFDRIGVFDPRYFGYFGDVDFGLRLQRAGFKMVCAKGAWLWHEGAAAYRDQAERTGTDYAIIHDARMKVVNDAYRLFREKWDPTMPPDFSHPKNIPFEALRVRPLRGNEDYQAPLQPDPAICEVR